MFLSVQKTGFFTVLKFVILFIVGSLAVDIPISKCSKWDLDNDWVNNLDASVSLWERNDCPKIDCAILCDRDPSCRSFFQHPSLETCMASSSYKRGLPTDKAGQQGWNYYTKQQYCDEGYVFNQSLGLCYKFRSVKKTFNDAMITCEAEGAKLIIIRNEAEFNLITQVMHIASLQPVLIGLRTRGANRNWKWWNGQNASYFSWNNNEPNDPMRNETCVFLSPKYCDIMCTGLAYFVCQRFVK